MGAKRERAMAPPRGPRGVASTPASEEREPLGEPGTVSRSLAGPGNMTPADILQLQRAAGNQAVLRLIQTRLAVGPADYGAVLPVQSEMGGSYESPGVGGTDVVQRQLPNVNLPRVGAQEGGITYPANLTRLARAWMDDSLDNTKGATLTRAVSAWAENQGLVQYNGQADIVPGSPEFNARPSSKAAAFLRQSNAPTATTGLAYTYDQRDGNPRYKVEIYPTALQGDSEKEVVAFLAQVITHEYIHVLQFRQQATDTTSREFQAYLWQAENALRMGIEPNSATANQILGQLSDNYAKLPPTSRRSLRARFEAARRALSASPARRRP